MATDDDTTNRGRSRGAKQKSSVTPPTEASATAPPTAAAARPATWTPQRTLKEAVVQERTLLLEVHAMLHCLHEVLLYTEDDDAVLHAEVAHAAARMINESAARLDTVHFA